MYAFIRVVQRMFRGDPEVVVLIGPYFLVGGLVYLFLSSYLLRDHGMITAFFKTNLDA